MNNLRPLFLILLTRNHGCQMAIAGFLHRLHLALRASGLWLRYAALQKLIPSFPWIAPLHHGASQGKEGIKFCHLATLVEGQPPQVGGRRGQRARGRRHGLLLPGLRPALHGLLEARAGQRQEVALQLDSQGRDSIGEKFALISAGKIGGIWLETPSLHLERA